MAGFLTRLKKSIGAPPGEFHNRHFLEAAMATSALVAMADEDVRFSERVALDHVLDHVEQLRVYQPERAVELHRSFVESLGADAAASRARLLEIIGRCRGHSRSAHLLVRIGIAIAKADSELSATEVDVITEICATLEVDTCQALDSDWEPPPEA